MPADILEIKLYGVEKDFILKKKTRTKMVRVSVLQYI